MNKLEKTTGLYSFTKTVKLELKPEKETKKRFEEWLQENSSIDEEENMFLKDRKIAEAYATLKPVLDTLHEKFIEISLSSISKSPIDYQPYLEAYRDKNVSDNMEKELRRLIGNCFWKGESYFRSKGKKQIFKVSKQEKIGQKVFDAKKSCLQTKEILSFIKDFIDEYKNEELDAEKLGKCLNDLKGFYTYFSGYNTNKANYYECENEKSTAISTRIIHENLPKFCDNIIRFEKCEDEYLSIFEWLKNKDKIIQIKNITSNKFEQSEPINGSIFDIAHFNYCLTQSQIEEYNSIIGNHNLLINLYNQARLQDDKSFRKLEEFTMLYKQIGCGKRKNTFSALLKDRESELTENLKSKGKILTVETLLKKMKEIGEKLFSSSKDASITIQSFINFLRNCNDWRGIYWSKMAVNAISSKYFANWHAIKDSLKEQKTCITYDKKREEPIQLRDAIELSGLFEVIDCESSEYIFKSRLIEEGFVDIDKNPSKNLINLLCEDIENHVQFFLASSDTITSLKQYRQKECVDNEEDPVILQIKEWFDHATIAMRIVKYFSVRASKMKGHTANPEMEKMLTFLLHNDEVDWFGWYDLIRNYLTRKPQDDVTENKLKLNFGTSSLLKGWSDGEEMVKAATLLKNGKDTFLCILKNKKVFDTSEIGNPIYVEVSNASRLILRNLKFQTLAGKGFVGEFGESYSEMGTTKPQKAIKCLQRIIDKKYVTKYPTLRSVVCKEYDDKKSFDAEVSKALEESYICDFVPVNWEMIKEKESDGELFLFKVVSKDSKDFSTGRKDLQSIYWENVLDNNSAHQLCAGAEIFMRFSMNGPKVSHKIGEKLVNKKDVNKNVIPSAIYKELFMFYNGIIQCDELSKESKYYVDNNMAIVKDVKHEILKDKRFHELKYLFHCPIKLNYESKSYKNATMAYYPINKVVQGVLQNIPNLNFIGIDRGEKHLVYSCTIDKDCNIINCGHYDNIDGTNYVQKLEEKAGNRLKQKQNWQQQDNIKNLKNGYISHVVHLLTNSVIKDEGGIINPHAYIVLEDLSTEMKHGRQKIEKQVYQKLETALAKKLNFVVDKNVQDGELASVSKALQLTPPLQNYDDIKGKKQFGVMLYTRANYTSITDPATGWRQTIYLKDGNEIDIKNQIMSKFTDFGFDGKDFYFEYVEDVTGKTWRMYSGFEGNCLPRFKNKKEKKEEYNIWCPEAIDVVSLLEILFINFDKSVSFKKQIENNICLTKPDGKKETAWQLLRFVINMIQQIRNSGTRKEDDNFLYSPVRDENGTHFDTRNSINNVALHKIVDADANGAYNIARKGLIMDSHIKYWIERGCPTYKNSDKKDVDDLDLFISDKEWDMWLLNREMWKQQLPYFASKSSKNEGTPKSKRKRIKK